MVTYISVPVPDYLVPAVMTFIMEQSEPKSSAPLKPWSALELAQLWKASGKPVREFLAALSSLPDTLVPTSSLMKVMTSNTSTAQFAGMMGAFGRRCANHHGGRKPFEYEWDVNAREYQYRMPSYIAAVLAALPV